MKTQCPKCGEVFDVPCPDPAKGGKAAARGMTTKQRSQRAAAAAAARWGKKGAKR
jgi:hypothetical protein